MTKRASTKPDVVEWGWLAAFRSLPPHLQSYLVQAAADIAAGREPAPLPGGAV